MKKTTLTLSFIVLLVMAFAIRWGISNSNPSKLERSQAVNSRIDNLYYWVEKAEKGLVPFNPEKNVNPSRFTGSKILSKSVLTDDSPDIPVTTINSTQSENSVFVDPNNAEQVLNSNNSTENPVGGLYGANDLFSLNGGETWEGEVEGAGGENSGDPTTAIGLNGRWYVNYIDESGGMGISYSDDQGSSWSTKTVAPNPGDLADKNHMWIDNSSTSQFEGNLYIAWTEFGGSYNNEIAVSVSNDDGLTWSTKKAISEAVNAGSHNQGVNLSVGPNGEVYAVWAIYDSWPTDESAIGMATSLDGGITWSPAVRVIDNIRGIRNSGTGKDMRVNSFPSAAADISGGSNGGNIYITWANTGVPGINTGNEIDVYLIASSDLGETWTDPIKVNQNESGLGKKSYFPWIACDPANGALSVVFYDDRNVSAQELEVFCANSDDGGLTWEDFKVSDVAFTPSPIPGLASSYFGDYLGITAQDGWVYPVWTDNRDGVTMTYCSPYQLNTLSKPYNLTAEITFETGNCDLTWNYEEAEGFTHFNLFRDDVLITTLTDTTYTDLLPDYGFYTYKITAAYTEERESGASRISAQWGDAHITVAPLSLYEHLSVDSQSTKTLQVINTGQLTLNYTLSPLVIRSNTRDPEYCDANGGGNDEYIKRVQVGDIDNSTGQTEYGDYTELSTLMLVGDSYPITVTNGDPNWDVDECAAWIDWNQNGEFESDELVAFEGSPGVGPYTGEIVPPVGALSGPTRMRVRINYNETPTPCGSASWGEVEDYTVLVQGWLDINPLEGSIAAGDTTNIQVGFDATDLEEGSYFAEARFFSNDPLLPEIIVPIQLDVSSLLLVVGTADDLTTVCIGSEIQLTTATFGLNSNLTYNWTSNPEGFTSVEADPFTTPETDTWYFVHVQNDTTSATDSIFIQTIEYPVVELGADTSLCGSSFTTLNAGNPGSTYLWSTGETTQTIVIDSNTVFSGYGSRTIQVNVTLGNLCSTEDERILDFVNCTSIDEQTIAEWAVYPNPSNGQFAITIENTTIKKFNILIYDLQGQVVYNSWHQESGIDKNIEVPINLTDVPSGNYVLVLKNDDFKVTKQIIIK